ncbi:MAG TPA: ribonuclease D [Candidatus Limnocylindrales bacterium]|nr:ribonuclease D [Candidatus Limnocylindrales bacterium]
MSEYPAVDVAESAVDEAPAPLPPLELRDGLPLLTATQEDLDRVVRDLFAGTGPIAVDTERASGYRYGQRAYLIQLRREGAGTSLIDPHAVPGVPGLAEALRGPEWILHAASQDLPCLAELDLAPTTLFDTELAGRLLGMPRVGLGPMVEDVLGMTLAKGHGAADWSRRPLPEDWLEYAALDVEVLIELRAELRARLVEAGKLEWAEQEFAAVRDAPPPPPRVDPWRRTSGIHKLRSRRSLAIVEHLWVARDRIAQESDTAPGRLLPDSSIVAAAQALPRDLSALQATRAFHGRGATRYQRAWAAALRDAWAVPEKDLPLAALKGDGPPPPRAWAQRDPVAAARLDRARTALQKRAAELDLPVENLLTPDLVRRLMWQPPEDPAMVAQVLADSGARTWQVELAAPLLVDALTPAAG